MKLEMEISQPELRVKEDAYYTIPAGSQLAIFVVRMFPRHRHHHDYYTTRVVPHLPQRLFTLLPQLKNQGCRDNGERICFTQEALSTEIPHLLEHLILEIQGKIRQPTVPMHGLTEWNWNNEPWGHFRVYIQYEHEEVIRTAIAVGEHILKQLYEKPDVVLDLQEELTRIKRSGEPDSLNA